MSGTPIPVAVRSADAKKADAEASEDLNELVSECIQFCQPILIEYSIPKELIVLIAQYYTVLCTCSVVQCSVHNLCLTLID